MSNARMLAGFAEYIDKPLPPDHTIIGMPVGARCHRITRLPNGWRVWIATTDYVYGTYLELHDSGRVCHCTVRRDEGEEVFQARQSDDEIRRKLNAR
jgi:hypothetical protein